MGDVQATNQIFNNLLELMQKQGIRNRKEILKFQDSRISKL